MTDRVATAFAPATVPNVACGFDVLGFSLESPGDEIDARILTSRGSPGRPGTNVRIDSIVGGGGRLPREAGHNTAGVAAQALLSGLGERCGVGLTIRKGLPLAVGL